MGRCMARRTRAGTLVGPGAKRKLRPAMWGPARSGRADVWRPLHLHRDAEFSPTITLCELFHKIPVLRPNPLPPSRILLADLYAAATRAAAPGPALLAGMERLDLDPDRRVCILALGKASMPMAQAATESLRSRGRAPVGGLVVAPAANASPHPSLRYVAGDHPEPGPGSF